jgi:hypothetical protein
MSYMTSIALQPAGSLDAPRLRLLPARSGAARRATATSASDTKGPVTRRPLRLFSRPAAEERPVLLAGGDSAKRQSVLRDLTRSMSASAVIEQAGAVWEVLARAGDSSLVVLSGELEDVSAESLMQMLAHRHPGLPVVTLEGPGSTPPESARIAC